MNFESTQPQPELDQAHRRLARVFVHVGFFEEALQHAERALAINPSNAQALNSRAQALLWSGKDEEALAILQSIPGPVLPELVEANTVFAFLRLNMGTGVGEPRGSRQISGGSKRRAAWYGGDARGRLRSQQGSSVDPKPAATLPTPRIMRRISRAALWLACDRPRKPFNGCEEAAATGFPCYSLFARDPNLDPSVRTLAFRRSRRRWRGRPRHSAGRCFRR